MIIFEFFIEAYLAFLQSRVAKFLPDDVLTVGVELTVYGDHNCTDLEPDVDAFCRNSGSSTSLCINDEMRIRLDPHFMGKFWEFNLHIFISCHIAIQIVYSDSVF